MVAPFFAVLAGRSARVTSMRSAVSILVLTTCFTARASKLNEQPVSSSAKGSDAMSLQVSTNAFAPGGIIPKKFTCSGEDVSPGLSWTVPHRHAVDPAHCR